MKTRSKVVAAAAFALIAALAVQKPALAETYKKLHSAVQRILAPVTGVPLTSANQSTRGISSTVDLSGGDLDKCSFQIKITSSTSTGTPTLDAAVQVSADGGTTWTTAGSFTQITSTSASAASYLKQDVATGPGTKLRVVLTSSANTEWNGISIWALPNTN